MSCRVPDLEFDSPGWEIAFLCKKSSCCDESQPSYDPLHLRLEPVPPIVGSLFSWKSLFTNRRTSEDYTEVSTASMSVYGDGRYLSYRCLAQKNQLDTAARLWGRCFSHVNAGGGVGWVEIVVRRFLPVRIKSASGARFDRVMVLIGVLVRWRMKPRELVQWTTSNLLAG